MGTRKDSSL
jgi:hypothetical protein